MDTPTNPVLELLKGHIGKTTAISTSPYARWINGTLREVSHGAVTIELLVREEMTNPLGTLHGGVIAGVMDEFIGMAAASAGVGPFASINLVVDFLRSVRMGDTVLIKARMVRVGRNVVNAECEVTDHEHKVLARGTSNLFRFDNAKQ